ncbi:hypothetical protein PHET_10083 [Paragonimus heterotremus]|uniref:Uncharacterized protein n=1 Tax=Paragonimus heterotremus TaxID=100268 RepID=A0A8J4WE30_9TREM|nr:hypothetical protein PHET_10083 [Paragonimus heterotremus]
MSARRSVSHPGISRTNNWRRRRRKEIFSSSEICNKPARCYPEYIRSFSAFYGCHTCTGSGADVGCHIRLLSPDADGQTD